VAGEFVDEFIRREPGNENDPDEANAFFKAVAVRGYAWQVYEIDLTKHRRFKSNG